MVVVVEEEEGEGGEAPDDTLLLRRFPQKQDMALKFQPQLSTLASLDLPSQPAKGKQDQPGSIATRRKSDGRLEAKALDAAPGVT